MTPALRDLVLGGDAEPDASGLAAVGDLRITADEVFAGPEPAAVRTAEAMGFVPTVDRVLRDRYYGSWNGRSLEELLATEPDPVAAWLEQPHLAPPGGESAADLMSRVADWLSARAGMSRRTAAIVHPAVARAAVLHVLDAPPEAIRRIDIRPLSTVHLTAHATTWSLTFP